MNQKLEYEMMLVSAQEEIAVLRVKNSQLEKSNQNQEKRIIDLEDNLKQTLDETEELVEMAKHPEKNFKAWMYGLAEVVN